MIIFAHSKCKRYENRKKFKVLLYLKKSGLDKNGKVPIMGRITVNRTMAQFSCKLSCTPLLWNPRASRLEGKSKEAVETNKDIDLLLLSIQKAFDGLVEKRMDFEAKDVKEALQGCVKTQVTLLSFVDEHIGELSTHEGIDMSKSSIWTYKKIRKNLAEFICEKYKLTDLAFGQLTEPFISEFHHYLLDEKGYSSGTIVIYVSLFKKMCRIAFERGLSKNLLFAHYRVGTPRVTTPKALTISDFIKIRDIELPEDKPRLSISRDLFLFACYAGTAYIDTVSITKANIKVLEDGDKWLVYHRKKTGTLARVKLLPEALELIARYEDKARDTLFLCWVRIVYASTSSLSASWQEQATSILTILGDIRLPVSSRSKQVSLICPGNNESAGKKKLKNEPRQQTGKSGNHRSRVGSVPYQKHVLQREIPPNSSPKRKEACPYCSRPRTTDSRVHNPKYRGYLQGVG